MTNNYSNRTVWIHWLTSILIFFLIYTGINMEHTDLNESKFLLYRLHFTAGIIVFILTIIRIFALLKDERPNALYPLKSRRQRFIKFVYNGFYTIIVWMCLSGIISLFVEGIMPSLKSGLLSDLPDINTDGLSIIMLSHHIVAKFVFLLLIFHITGFTLHLIQKKENTLKRIWFK
jgi:cytochrome b561